MLLFTLACHTLLILFTTTAGYKKTKTKEGEKRKKESEKEFSRHTPIKAQKIPIQQPKNNKPKKKENVIFQTSIALFFFGRLFFCFAPG